MATITLTQTTLQKIWKSPKDDDEHLVKEKVSQLAKLELRETKSAKKQGLEQMTKWLEKNTDVRNIRSDESFLLRFLRVKKFSVPMAQQMLLKWLLLRNIFPDMCKDLDCMSDKIQQIFDDGYIFVSPIRDAHGRRVIFYNVKQFNALKYGSEDMARVHFLTYETLLEDEDNQVMGFSHVADIEGISSGHVMCWSPSIFARIIRHGEQSIPMRHKEIHLLNVPKALKYVYEFAKSKMSPKINKRMSIHSNLSALHSAVDSSCLPKEYGGTIPMSEMISEWKKELSAKRNIIKSLDKMELLKNDILSTASKNNSDENNNPKHITYSLPGSFRKLEVD